MDISLMLESKKPSVGALGFSYSYSLCKLFDDRPQSKKGFVCNKPETSTLTQKGSINGGSLHE